jgi:hypothetical protein
VRWSIAFLVLAAGTGRGEVGSKACSTCHAQIYETYRRTGMARSSGRVTGIEIEGEFAHTLSGVRYRVYRQGGSAYFSFELPGVYGSRRLEYFIGSGAVGQSYAYSVDGFLYEAPVSWYSRQAAWALSPGYDRYDHLYLTRPVEPACLQCHASRLQPAPGTQNGFETPPFREDGISCERCHGSGEEHVRGRGRMTNPARLAPDRRDSVCAQCHLAGETQVPMRAQSGYTFRVGDRFADHVVTFVWSGGSVDMKVTSHFERLAQSACKRASGDRLWCGTCHDPHRIPAASEKAAYYRGKCLECHEARQCSRGPDCAGCHMPKNPVRDVEHAAYTEHAIRKPGGPVTPAKGERKLIPFGDARAGDREFGLAYSQVPGYESRAIECLERAPRDDAEVLTRLAFLYDSGGLQEKAIRLYEESLRIDPAQVTAEVNLGIALMKRGQPEAAMQLWRDALQRSPGLETARLSLAAAQYRSGDLKGAEAGLMKLLDLNPGMKIAREVLNEVRSRR